MKSAPVARPFKWHWRRRTPDGRPNSVKLPRVCRTTVTHGILLDRVHSQIHYSH